VTSGTEFVNVRKVAMAHAGPTDRTEVANPPNDTRLIARGRESFLESGDLGSASAREPDPDLLAPVPVLQGLLRSSGAPLPLSDHHDWRGATLGLPKDEQEGSVKRHWEGQPETCNNVRHLGSAEDCGRS
jgi:hypothetical protein